MLIRKIKNYLDMFGLLLPVAVGVHGFIYINPVNQVHQQFARYLLNDLSRGELDFLKNFYFAIVSESMF